MVFRHFSLRMPLSKHGMFCCAFVIFGRQNPSKNHQKMTKIGPRSHKIARKAPKITQERLRSTQERQKSVQERQRWLQDRPKSRQKAAQEANMKKVNWGSAPTRPARRSAGAAGEGKEGEPFPAWLDTRRLTRQYPGGVRQM